MAKGVMSAGEPRPPWVVSPSISPGDDPHWRTPDGQAWLRGEFLPFYDGLSSDEQIAYCRRWNAPTPWTTLFLHPDLDEVAADADEENNGGRIEPLNFRERFGVA